MSLIGSTNEEKIWNYLKAKGLPDCGIAGLMGNLYAESCLIPTNLQNSYEKALSFTDAAYTATVWRSGHIGVGRRTCSTSLRRRARASVIWRCSLIFSGTSCKATRPSSRP